jgi:peptidoglycan/xylan/chitin deacetylase (PgdA/CDA1 family)
MKPSATIWLAQENNPVAATIMATTTPAIPEVSIVTPARDAASTLGRTFASIARQAFKQWEHIVVTHPDDPATRLVASAQAERDRRIIHISGRGRTAGEARNIGLSHAQGRYVLFLDADDTISPWHLKRMVKRADRAQADVVASGYRRIGAGGRTIQRRVIPLDMVPVRSIRAGPLTALHALLFKRDLLTRIGSFDEGLSTNEDWDLCVRAVARDARFISIGGCSADYWTSVASLSSRGPAMIRDRQVVAERARQAHALNVGIDPAESGDDVARQTLRTALWAGAIAVARDEETAALLQELAKGAPFAPHCISTQEGGDALLEGLAIGFSCSYRNIEGHLETRWAALGTFVRRIADACCDPGFDAALLRTLEYELARLGPAAASRQIGSSLVQSVGRQTLPLGQMPASIEQVIFRVPFVRPRSLGTLALCPALADGHGPLSVASRRMTAWIAERPFAENGVAKARDRAIRGLGLAKRALQRSSRVLTRPTTADKAQADGQASNDWEKIFATENPWHYHRGYEQTKYEQTLALLPDEPIARALELACAEGHFTEQLASKVGRLTASDISSTALGRCRTRCREGNIDNIDFLELDFFREDFGQAWDLIVSSEVLYYMDSHEHLTRYVQRVCGALSEGGLFLHAHAFEVSDTPDRTGFDWGDEFAAGTICSVFAQNPDLVLEAAVESELYRCELYRKRSSARGADAVGPLAARVSVRDGLEPGLAADVVWNGAKVTRSDVDAQRQYRVPVLMYHAIANEGPERLAPWRTSPEAFEHQLRFLRRRGYRSISMSEWDAARAGGAALSGRPVVITFDDGNENFAENAWPILARNGFGAQMFVVSGSVGGRAAWDAYYGEPYALMDWSCLAGLVREGLEIGSHMHRHQALDRMTYAQIKGDAILSRETILDRLGVAPSTVAPPYGICSPQHGEVLRSAGFDRVFLASGERAPVYGPRLRTPRIEISADTGIDAFARLVGAHEAPEEADRP